MGVRPQGPISAMEGAAPKGRKEGRMPVPLGTTRMRHQLHALRGLVCDESCASL
jgi:hypothetical protein